MSEDEMRKVNEEETDEVEAHHKHRLANEEAPAEGDDDVEAHVKGAKLHKKL
jgi:hypothetical protein